jgi:anaerobic selenocysteine-containing dehydrogenase
MAEIIQSICQMCGTAYAGCGIDVYVEGGKVVKIEGTKGHPVNDGKLCPKGLAGVQMVNNPDRLQYPMKRIGKKGSGQFERISWDEAMDMLSGRLKQAIDKDGPQSIAWIKGQGPGWQMAWDFCQRFMNAIEAPNLVQHGHNCHFGRGAGHVATFGWMPDPDYEEAKLIILWGYNPVNTALTNHGIRIMNAKKRGVPLIVIDPRFSKTAAKADIFVQIRPGTDGALALGMMNYIIKENLHDKAYIDKWAYGFDKLAEMVEEWTLKRTAQVTWVPEETIRKVAHMYATIKPACLHDSNGIDQNPSVAQVIRAQSCLNVITGQFSRRGTRILDPEIWPFFPPHNRMDGRNYDHDAIVAMFQKSVSKYPFFYALGYVGMSDMMDAMTSDKPYPIKAAVVQGMNPAIITDNNTKVRKALTRVPFLAVFDPLMTPTAELADLVLPAATYLERDFLMKWWFGSKPRMDGLYFGLQRKVVKPLGECKDDFEFIRDLTWAMGKKDKWPFETVEEWIKYELEPVGITYQQLAENPSKIVWKKFTDEELTNKSLEKYLQLPFFPQHKIALYSDFLESIGQDPLPHYVEPGESPLSQPELTKKYPFVAMGSIKPGLFVHSQYRSLPWLKEIMPEGYVEIHPDTAGKLGVEDDEIVTVSSPRGSIDIRARVVESFAPGVVGLTHGWWDAVTNVLTPDEYRDPICGATSNHCFLAKISKRR